MQVEVVGGQRESQENLFLAFLILQNFTFSWISGIEFYNYDITVNYIVLTLSLADKYTKGLKTLVYFYECQTPIYAVYVRWI